MGLFRRQPPGGDDAGRWVERSLRWLREEFGTDPLGAPIVRPITEDIPGDFAAGREEPAHELLEILCAHLDVDADRVTLEVTPFAGRGVAVMDGLVGTGRVGYQRSANCGYHSDLHPHVVVAHPDLLTEPAYLVAVIAHDLAHVRLLGEERVTTARRDHEQLADLLTVYFGLGIFTANASYDSVPTGRGGRQLSRLGYLPEPVFGYALACYAWLRGEPAPDWSGHLDHGPRQALYTGVDYLGRMAEPGELPEPEET